MKNMKNKTLCGKTGQLLANKLLLRSGEGQATKTQGKMAVLAKSSLVFHMPH